MEGDAICHSDKRNAEIGRGCVPRRESEVVATLLCVQMKCTCRTKFGLTGAKWEIQVALCHFALTVEVGIFHRKRQYIPKRIWVLACQYLGAALLSLNLVLGGGSLC